MGASVNGVLGRAGLARFTGDCELSRGAGISFPADGLFSSPWPGVSLFVRDAGLSARERRDAHRYEMLV